MEILFLIGRILFGGFFVMNGINHFSKRDMMAQMTKAKGIPAPKLAVVGSGVIMLLAGLGIVFGIYPIYSLILVLVFMVPVTFTMHAFWSAPEEEKMGEMINFMKNIALIGATLMLLLLGSNWVLSISF